MAHGSHTTARLARPRSIRLRCPFRSRARTRFVWPARTGERIERSGTVCMCEMGIPSFISNQIQFNLSNESFVVLGARHVRVGLAKRVARDVQRRGGEGGEGEPESCATTQLPSINPPAPRATTHRLTRHPRHHPAPRAAALSQWDRHILSNRHALLEVEEELKRVGAGQEALERKLYLLETHQKVG
jgi:hypothetical protein